MIDDWKCDQYRWYQNGTKKLPKKNPVLRKVYYVSVTPEGNNNLFRRNTYSLLANQVPALTLVHYLGDETIAADFPHGNAKRSAVQQPPHVRTCPSVLRVISKSDKVPSNVYKKAIAENDCVPALQLYQIQEILSKWLIHKLMSARSSVLPSHDALYNIHELAYDLDGFIAKIITYPDLVLICGSKNMARELDQLLQCQSPAPQLLSYDTTFQLGDFFVSPLLFRHTAFTSSPVMPLLFLIHDRKFQNVHEEVMKHTAAVVPSLTKTGISVPIVTDDETGICNAIDTYLPNLARLKCWNHTINAAKVNLSLHLRCS